MRSRELISRRLRLRPWTVEDAEAAVEIFGASDVALWLTPAMSQVPDVAAMRSVLEAWVAEDDRMVPPLGRWAVELLEPADVAEGVGSLLVGSVALLPLPPDAEDAEIAWQTNPRYQGRGYASEAGGTLIRWAFGQGLPEVFAVTRPNNRAGLRVTQHLGMEWVGQTDKYYGLTLDVHRARPADLRAVHSAR
jgi:[ribosomal protein S5]-alanine N-acetyltransferase